jgi:hypothetical protein
MIRASSSAQRRRRSCWTHTAARRHGRAQRAVHARHRQRRVLERLHQHAAPLGPRRDALLRRTGAAAGRTPRPHSRPRKGLGVHVVGREMVAAARTSPERSRSSRVMRCSDSMPLITGQVRQQVVIGVHQQLAPRRSTGSAPPPAVVREPPVLDQAARLEQRQEPTVGRAVERHRQLEFVGAHAQAAQVSATRSESPASWNSGGGGPQRAEADVAVAQDEHRGHRATRPCTRPAICRISFGPRCMRVSTLRPRSITLVKRVVDDHRVEPRHVERALPAAVIASRNGFSTSPSRKGRITRIGSPPW